MKKAQAATEFLITYGWVILIVIVAIGALTYFGFSALRPPERCIFQTGTSCLGNAFVSTNNITFVLVDNLGADINVTNVTATAGRNDCVYLSSGWCSGIGCSADSSAKIIKANDKITFVVNCINTLTKGNKYKGDFVISYRNMENGLDTQAMGNIIGIVS